MPEKNIAFKKTERGKTILFLSVLVCVFWCLGRFINVYRFAFVGVIFEILWLPMLGMLFLLPIISMVFLVKEKFTVRSLHLYSILIIVATILLMVFYK